MNRKRREILRSSVEKLTAGCQLVTKALYEEQDCLDNIPDSLVDSEAYAKMESAVDYLSDAEECINEAIEKIRSASI